MFERIGFIGTGLMGAGMAKTLARKGYRVTAYNRTRSRVDALVPDGVAVVADPAAAARTADAVICMLPHVGTLAELLVAVRAFIDPVLSGATGTWEPERWSW